MIMEKPIKQKYFVKHWVSALVVGVLVCLIGIVGLNSLSIEQYPNIAPPQVVISASYTGADVASIMKSVIMPIEEQVNGVEDMMYISSSAFSNGSAEINVVFKQGTDADKATVNVQNRVSQAEGILPAAVTQQGVTVQKSVNSILQIQSLESTDDRFDQKFIINYGHQCDTTYQPYHRCRQYQPPRRYLRCAYLDQTGCDGLIRHHQGRDYQCHQ